MRAGTLDRRIALQRKTDTISDEGEPISSWSTIATRWAQDIPVSGSERYGGQQLEAREQIEFRVRWSFAIADLQPTDRLIYPASDVTASPLPRRSIYDILAVLELGRREGFRIFTARQPVAG